jgi:large repetitive protein
MIPAACARALTLVVLCLLCPTMVAAQIVTGAGPGANATVRVIGTDGTDRSFLAYPEGFGGGANVALGDVNGDGVLDIITGAGPGGGPHVRVWNGVTLAEIGGFFAYHPAFPGGVSVAAADINGDGLADIITGAGPGGGPHVRVWNGADFTEIGGFFAYHPAFPGGVSVAAGDVNGDGRADIITGAGPGGGPHVRVWSGTDFTEIGGFFAYHPAFPGGVHVAAGDVNGDGLADIITGAGPGGGPHVRVWNGATFAEIGGFFAYDPAFPGGVTVGALDLTNDGRVEIFTAPGPGAGPLVAIWSGIDFSLMGAYFAFDPSFTGGVSIGSPGGSNALRFTSAGATTFHVLTPHTFTVTTVGGSAVPTLTVSGVLPTGVTFTDNGDRTATLAGTAAAGTGGSYPLTFTATGGSATPVTQTFTLTITQSPAITSAAATTFGLGGPGTFTVTTTGFPAPTLSSSGALPAGVTFTDNGNGTATLAGTPAPGSGGTYPLTISAANGNTPDAIQSFVLTVNSSPAFTSANATTFTVGAAGTFAITTIATPPVTSIARTGAALPTGVTYVDHGNGTATLAGTPAAGTGGTYVLTLTAANGVGTNAVQTFTLTVRQAPAITSAAATTFTVGAAGSFAVTTTGFPAAGLTVTGALPSGVTFVDNGNGSGSLAGTPAAGTGGTYPLSITAANGVGSNAVQSFTLTVNQAPAFTSANATTFTVGAAGTFTVTTSGVPGVTTIARTGAALPSGVTYVDNLNGTATLAGTPAAGTGGVYAFTFTINNGVGGNVTQSFALTITEAPAFTSAASTTFVVGSVGTFTVTTAAEPDVTTITIGGVALPAGVTFVSNGDGTATLSGTPGAGTGGTYALTFTANNGIGGNVVQNFTLTVNQTPAFTSANTTTFTVSSFGSFTVTTSGVPGVTAIARTGAALPGGVTFVDNADGTGTLSGTPGAATGGAYALIFTINNGVGGNVVQNFTLNVNAPPAITSATSDTFVVGTLDSFTVTTTGLPTPVVTHTSGTLPGGITFTSATRVLGGTATQIGAFPLQFTAANGVGTNAVQAFTLNVVCPTITVSALSLADAFYLTAYTAVDFNQAGSTGSSFMWSATGLPAGMTIDASTGVVSGTPTNTQPPTAVAITVTDNFGCTGVHNTTLTVRPTADNENYVGGVGNTQYVVSAAVPTTPHVFFVDNVKNGDNGPGALTVAFGPAVNGTVAEGPTDGTFTYTPNVNFAGPTDQFSYTLTDGNGVTNTATVTINLSGLVWYVNSSASNGDGRSHLPFNSVTNAQAPSGAGQIIYVHTGAASTPGTITLKPTQTLWGAGAAFSLNSLTIPFTGTPTLAGTITLANGVLLSTFNVNGGSGAAITGTNVGGNVAINSVNVVGGTTGITLTNQGGTLTFETSAVVGVTPGASLLLSGGTATMSGRLAITSTVGRSVDIQGKTAGTATLGGAIVDTGSGIFLSSNTGATIAFTGGLNLNTGANPAFTAIGGGTVTVTQNNTTVVNTLTTTTGAALNVANTTIGAAGLTVRSISANGGVNGIVLNNTGATAGLTVAGDGSVARNGSGGTIQNTSGDAIQLTNANNVTLQSMTLFSNGANPPLAADAAGTSGNHTIEVSGGSNLILSGVFIDAPDGDGLLALNLAGTNRINNNSRFENLAAGAGHAIYVSNTNTNMTLFEMNNIQMVDNNSSYTNFFFANNGTSNMALTVQNNCLFEDLGVQALTVAAGGVTATTGTLTSNIIGNTFQNGKGVGENNVGILVNNGGTHLATVQNNLFDNIAKDGTIANTSILRTQNSGGVMTATVTGNTIQNIAYAVGGRHAIGHIFEPVTFNAADSSTLFFTNNTVNNVTYTSTNREAIVVDFRATASGGEVTIQGNNVNMPTTGSQQAVELRFRQANASSVNVLVRGNTIAHNTSVAFLDVDAEAAASVQLTIDAGNNFTNSNGTPGQTIAVASETATSSMCANITGNTLQSGVGTITVEQAAGTLTVTQASAAALAAASGIPSGNVTVIGGVLFGQPPCTIP